MGIEAALIGGGLGLVGNLIKSNAQKRASQQMANSTGQAIDLQRQMFEQGQAATSPYRQAGQQALGQFQGLMTPQGQAQFAQEYTQGPMFGMLQDQAEQATLRNASATGGLRTGQANVALSSIAPQLINQAYGQQLQGLQSLMGQGYGAASQTAGLAPQVGAQLGGLTMQQGSQQAMANTAMQSGLADTLGQFGGLMVAQGLDNYYGGRYAPTQTFSRAGQTFGR